MQILSLSQVSIIKCVVKIKETEEVVYEGDSSFEANQWYNKLQRGGIKAMYVKGGSQLLSEKEKYLADKPKENSEILAEKIKLLPSRISDIYFKLLAGVPIPEEVEALAKKFHPEYFNINKI